MWPGVSVNPLSLKVNFSWVLVSNSLYGVYQWLIIAVLAKLSGPETVGQFGLAGAVVIPVQMFLNMQLRALQASDASERYTFSQYLSLRLMTSCAAIVLLLGLSLAWPFSPGVRMAILGVLAIKTVESVSDIIYGAFQHGERMDISSRSRMMESIVAVLSFSLAFRFTGSLLISLLSIASSQLIVLAVYTIPKLRTLLAHRGEAIGLSRDFAILSRLLVMALPLGITVGILNLNSALPRLTLGYFGSEYEVGILAAFTQLVVSGTIVIGALGQAVTPVFARDMLNENYRHFFSLLRKMLGVAFGIGIAGCLSVLLLGEPVVSILYTPDFLGHQTSLLILAASSGFTFAASFQGYALTAARIISPQIWLFIAVGVVMLISLLLAVPILGLNGAVLGILLASMAQFVLSGIILQTKLRADNDV